METGSLFESGNAPVRAEAPGSGFLVTNHLNLMHMLASGLLMPPAGFGGKYYQDTLGAFPGWIPLFIGKVSRGAIESSVSEARHLKPVIVEVGLASLSGPLIALGECGLRELQFPDGIDGAEKTLLAPAPLPTSWIKTLIFRSLEEKRACEADAKDYGNVPLQDFNRRSMKTWFTKALNVPWPPTQGPAARSAPLHMPLGAGGVMAMLLLMANRSELGVLGCRYAFDPDDDSAPSADDPILAGLRVWMQTGAASLPIASGAGTAFAGLASLQQVSQEHLFWGAVGQLVDWREAGGVGNVEDILLAYLEAASAKLDPQSQVGARKLHRTLVSLRGLGDATASELFERHATPLARALALFFMRRKCADLIDCSNDRLHERDWLAAAILFGVRDGWLGLPLQLRAVPELPVAVSHRMARLAQRIAGTGIDLGPSPERVRPLRELFGDGSAWRAQEQVAAVELARKQKWDCIHTRISFGRGEYRLRVEGGSVHIDLPGEPRVAPDIDRTRFFDCLAKMRMDAKVEEMARAKLQA